MKIIYRSKCCGADVHGLYTPYWCGGQYEGSYCESCKKICSIIIEKIPENRTIVQRLLKGKNDFLDKMELIEDRLAFFIETTPSDSLYQELIQEILNFKYQSQEED